MPQAGPSTRKRPGDDSLSPPVRKHARLSMGSSESGTLGDRWRTHVQTGWVFAVNTVELVRDTIFPQPSLPTHVSRAASTHSSMSSAAAPPSTSAPSTSSPTDAETETTPSQTPVLKPSPSIGWPSTSVTKSYYPQVDRELQKKLWLKQHRPKRRKHIFEDQHKAKVEATKAVRREDTLKQIYVLQKEKGYSADFPTFRGLMRKQLQIQRYMESTRVFPRDGKRSESVEVDDSAFLRRILEKARATLNEPRPPPPHTPHMKEVRYRRQIKDIELEKRLRAPTLPSSLPSDADAQVDALLKKSGVISKYAREQVASQDIARLKPALWLNDEIINFYGALVLGRSEGAKENSPNGPKNVLAVHYFSTFFWPKLVKEGYEKGRLSKWTKKLDLFSKDVILIPVNHANLHWTAAAINFRQKRIESYDSLGDDRPSVYKHLREYVDQEHRNKKKAPFDFTGWVDYTSPDIPQQENGYDCGVFTCQFLESLSRGAEPFNFSQKDIPYLRRRMIWEIGNATLRTEY
ncbi:Cysteine proteinase [Mycena indigotica]|uniref:Cysteine proteinase n=1 Tax=Mycena indigotica TaxID=2126181 RepID=A0A8H6W8B7_9AGAR|nr:Cysteine proteinase [Mycena indigotica]KAF7306736.1 Cysteine proteinase [Mycena indigotica]